VTDTSQNHATFPAAFRLLINGFWPGSDEKFIDPGAALEYGISASHASNALRAAAHEMRQMLDRAPDDEAFEDEMGGLGMQIALPEGNSWRIWGERALARIEQAIADPSTIEADPVSARFVLPRTSRFTDQDTANAATTAVLRAHEVRFRAWAQDPQGWLRLHLYADLGREIGRVLGRTQDGGPRTQTVAAKAAVVLIQRDPGDGQVYIASAYPEVNLDVPTRDRFPDLCNAFGGYFGQDMDTVPWGMRNNLLGSTADPARSRLRTQLEELLVLDDPQLAAAVHALGSYLLPAPLRSWVRRLWTGIDDYDWTRPDDDR
jgi:hypothetical protein